MENQYRAHKKLIVIAACVVLAIILVFSTVASVPRNHVGILIRAGVVQEVELSEGWHLKIPFVDKIESMSNAVNTLRIASGTTNATTKETAETKDRQLIPVFEFEVYYQLSKEQSFSVYKNYGAKYEDALIKSNALAIIKQVFSSYDSEEIVVKKAEIPDRIATLLNEVTSPVGIAIRRVNMITYDFTPEYTAILEERAMLTAQVKNNQIKQENERVAAQTSYDVAVKEAEKQAETARIKAENDKEIALMKAQQEKETALIQANAKAEADKINADNEAYVVTKLAEAEKEARLAAAEATKAELEAQASGLNDLVVQKSMIEKWNGQLMPAFGSGNGFTFTDLTQLVTNMLEGTYAESSPVR